MKNNSRNIIFAVIIFVLLAIGVTISVLQANAHKVPDGVIGNTAGNLNNLGLFCESEGVVYFSNPYDMNTLYSMTPEGNDLKKLCDMTVEYINVGGDYVFFYGRPNKVTSGIGSVVSKPGMYRVKKDGKNLRALSQDITRSMVLVGNEMYYQHYDENAGTTFAVMDLKSKKSTELLSYMINPASYYNGAIYYNGMYNDHNLYRFDLSTKTETRIWEGDIWNPIYDGNFVYYMDVRNNYRLCRYSITNNTIEVLTNERMDFFNVYGDFIFYQVSSSTSPALKRMRLDGSESVTIAEGVYTDINVTSTYVYFTLYGSEVPVYKSPTYGAPNVTEFTAARDASLKNIKK